MLFTALHILLLIFILCFGISAMVHVVYLVPYVPSTTKVVKRMIEVAKIKPKETVVDLGCGDGRLLFFAEKSARGVKAVGFEIAPLMYLMAKLKQVFRGSRAEIRFQSLFRANLKSANVIFCYLFPDVMKALVKKIRSECRPGTRIVSNTFKMPDMKLSHKYPKDPAKGLPSIYVYTV